MARPHVFVLSPLAMKETRETLDRELMNLKKNNQDLQCQNDRLDGVTRK